MKEPLTPNTIREPEAFERWKDTPDKRHQDGRRFARVFHRVAACARQYVSTMEGTFDSRLAEDLTTLYTDSDCADIDYESYAIPFTHKYFLLNYWKASAALVASTPALAHRVTDAGCGSGAMGLAYLAYLSSSLGDGNWTVRIDFIDRSAAQIQLARTFVEVVRHELNNISLVASFRTLDLRDWNTEGDLSECVLLGHVLTENTRDIGKILESSSRSTRADGRMLVIERTDDPIWSSIERSVSHPLCRFGTSSATVAVSDHAAVLTDRSRVETRYLALTMPHRAVLAELLALYFEAWRHKRTDLLDKVFDEDAEYVEKPFSIPIRGIADIKEYWRTTVLPQRDQTLNVRRTVYSDDEALAEWTADFVLRGVRVRVIGTLILSVPVGCTKAHRLREYFRTCETEE